MRLKVQVGSGVTRRNGGTTRHRKGPQNLPNLTTKAEKTATLRTHSCSVKVHCGVCACDTCAPETQGVCAREGVCEQLSCPSSLLCLFLRMGSLCVVALPDPERLSARATLFLKGGV